VNEQPAAPLPAGISHLLAANDALIPDRWGVHITLCGEEVRRPGPAAEEHECHLCCDCVRYCPGCVREARRLSAEADHRASDPVR
jgi:NAD-dependent dihydropyrimidine dehydrogenase PreA subunit